MKYIIVITTILFTTASFVSAHATAERSEPKVGAEISKPPADVKIWFSEAIEPAFSKIQVFAPDGKEIDKKDSHVDPKDKRLLIVSLPGGLPAGTYRVHWQVVSIDTHRTQNDFKLVLKSS
jgi:methionine-rich copper-binding protein CopC